MRISVPAETTDRERRVALTPAVVAKLTANSHQVWIESGCGVDAGFGDKDYEQAGATPASRDELLDRSELIVTVDGTGWVSQGELPSDSTLIGLLDPLWRASDLASFAPSGVSSFALELMPRTTRAQSMDVLSSMATVAGYQAALLAATKLPAMFPLMMTAAGTVPAARVLVIGAGVAGLQAIATCRRLGAVVTAYDIRPAAQEQIASVGAKTIDLDLDTGSTETELGYAADQGEQLNRIQAERLAPHIAAADVVISTAAIPGQTGPELIIAEAVSEMSAGSIVIDLAAASGGNCRLSRPDEEVTHHGVTIVGPTDLVSRSAATSSQLFATNLLAFVEHLCSDGELVVDQSDDIVTSTLVTRHGEVVNPRIRQLAQDETR